MSSISSSNFDDASSGAMYAAVPISEVMSTARAVSSERQRTDGETYKLNERLHENNRSRTQLLGNAEVAKEHGEELIQLHKPNQTKPNTQKEKAT